MQDSRVIWLGDLNYRVALSYKETRVLLEDNDWDALLEKDQVNKSHQITILQTSYVRHTQPGNVIFFWY